MHVLPIAAALAAAAVMVLAPQAGAEPQPEIPAVPTVPPPPGTAPVARPGQNPLNNAYLLPQNARPSAPGEGEIVGVEQGRENADISRWEYLRRLWGSHQDGGLEGGLLGQRDQDAAGRPLPESSTPSAPPAG